MDEEQKELIKAGADAAMKPFANLIEKLFGGSVEEIGGIWQDSLKVRRFQRQLKLFEIVEKLIADAGFEPRHVPDAISIPLLLLYRWKITSVCKTSGPHFLQMLQIQT